MVNWPECCEIVYADISRWPAGHRQRMPIRPQHLRAFINGSTEFSYCYDCLQILTVDEE